MNDFDDWDIGSCDMTAYGKRFGESLWWVEEGLPKAELLQVEVNGWMVVQIRETLRIIASTIPLRSSLMKHLDCSSDLCNLFNVLYDQTFKKMIIEPDHIPPYRFFSLFIRFL